MNKLAMFVEGNTELEFATKLITEIARANSVTIQSRKISGGSTCPRTSRLLKTRSATGNHEHFILLYDCGGDATVKKRLLEEYDNLVRSGYSKIICVRDVYPKFVFSEIERLEQGLKFRVKTKPILVSFVLQVMEVEAWFLRENTHFQKINSAITIEQIIAKHGFDPSKDDMSLRPSPANDLKACYEIAGESYTKGSASQTIDAVDFVRIYYEVVEHFPHLKHLCDELTAFLR